MVSVRIFFSLPPVPPASLLPPCLPLAFSLLSTLLLLPPISSRHTYRLSAVVDILKFLALLLFFPPFSLLSSTFSLLPSLSSPPSFLPQSHLSLPSFLLPFSLFPLLLITLAVVGYGTEGGKGYYILKNTWTTSWGMKGFMYIQRANNMCGIASVASYPEI
jgi:hypothetical protein